ncbi:amidohydrolase [Staphylococcus nepalensis]|uniref:amidohydrolase n=1 Tax=Staphylococcus nepalensis TaxID=214473 RepID=UPI001A99FEBE|nr:amidohydrolase [Staphylococcus nepalensis]MBO1217474.1 amidohydrolase [Staphylococcus nepalensis]
MKKADLLIKNGNILTLNHENSEAKTVAVAKGKIIGAWEQNEPPQTEVDITPETKVIDLKGRTMIPGFIETHNHILGYSISRKSVDCSSPLNQSISEILERIEKQVHNTPEGEWVMGQGYDDTLLIDNRHPNRDELDQISTKHPIIIRHTSGHLAVVNSAALSLAGIDENVKNPQGGSYGRYDNNRLNGVIYEMAAMEPVQAVQPNPTEQDLLCDLEEGSQEYIRQGITTNTDAAVGMMAQGNDLNVHLRAAAEKKNPMKSQLMIMHHLLRNDGPFGGYTAEQLDQEIQQRSNGRARLDSVKMFQDGSIQGLTAALREPYYNNHNIYGELYHNQEEFNQEIADLHKRGFRIAIHGNGDSAIGSILDGFEYALKQYPRSDHRHRIEHVQTATKEDLDRMDKLGVAGSFFINHVYYWGDRHEKIFLGPDRAQRINPLKDAFNRSLLFTLHSDCPITPISPLFLIWSAVNRITREGNVLGSDQCIDVLTALRAMTIDGAKINFDEKNSGSIEKGKNADFTILSANPLTVNAEEIKNIEILGTIIDGETVYKKPQSS